MKIVIRKGVFETNSSSTHTVTILNKENGKRKITDDFKKLIIILDHIWNKTVGCNIHLSFCLERLNIEDRENEEKAKLFFSLNKVTKEDLLNIYGNIEGNLDNEIDYLNYLSKSHKELSSLKELAIDTYLKKTNDNRKKVLKRIDDYFVNNKPCPLCNKRHKREPFDSEYCPYFDEYNTEKIIKDTFNNQIEYYSSSKGNYYKILYSDGREREVCDYENKLEVLIASCQLNIRDRINYLINQLKAFDFSFDPYYLSDDLLKKIILMEKVTLSELEEVLGEKVDTINGEISLEEYENQIIPCINCEIEEINKYRKRINNYLEAYCLEYAKGDLKKILEYHQDDWFINPYENPMCSLLFFEGPLEEYMCGDCPIYDELDNLRESYNNDREFALAFLKGEIKIFIGER